MGIHKGRGSILVSTTEHRLEEPSIYSTVSSSNPKGKGSLAKASINSSSSPSSSTLHSSREKRPLEHLAGEHLLCSGWLSTWRDSISGLSKELCIQGVDCRDWSTGKQKLAQLDHCWMRVTARCWQTLHRLGVLYGHHTSRLDKIIFVARPEYYRRANGTEDWGLYLLSSPPTTEVQAKGVYSEFRKLSKPQGTIANPAQNYRRFVITSTLLDLKIEDWRLYSTRGPSDALAACKTARRNAEAGLRQKISEEQMQQQAAQVKMLCQRRAEMILAGKAEILDLKQLGGR